MSQILDAHTSPLGAPDRAPLETWVRHGGDRGWRDKVKDDGRTWLGAFHARYAVARTVSAMLPTFVGGLSVRAPVYRWAGFDIGPDVAIVGKLTLISGLPGFYDKLVIGAGCTIAHHVTINLDDTVTLGRRVTLSPHVTIYTGNHRIGPGSSRSTTHLMNAPVTIEDGAWVRVGALILPGVTVGRGSVVAAGAVVSKDVPPNTYVEGNPASVVRRLPWGDR
jgi:maltose O-acetyltransferase